MKRILIVDDDPGVQDAYKFIFSRQKYEVVIYANGTEIFKNNYKLPDLFILDKQLSGIDGLDICSFLKKQNETKNIPVIMLSASPNLGKLAKSAGADDMLEEPFHIKELRKLVDRFLFN
ncbi:MAG TPA: response regulator [Puia sp.]|nr:response regulator [Puia sp.]